METFESSITHFRKAFSSRDQQSLAFEVTSFHPLRELLKEGCRVTILDILLKWSLPMCTQVHWSWNGKRRKQNEKTFLCTWCVRTMIKIKLRKKVIFSWTKERGKSILYLDKNTKKRCRCKGRLKETNFKMDWWRCPQRMKEGTKNTQNDRRREYRPIRRAISSWSCHTQLSKWNEI